MVQPQVAGPFATADKRAKDFGTLGSDGETALANEGLLAAMIDSRRPTRW